MLTLSLNNIRFVLTCLLSVLQGYRSIPNVSWKVQNELNLYQNTCMALCDTVAVYCDSHAAFPVENATISDRISCILGWRYDSQAVDRAFTKVKLKNH